MSSHITPSSIPPVLPQTQPALPEEVSTTLARLSAYRNVHGVLILSRSGGLIRSVGPAFDDHGDEGEEEEEEEEEAEKEEGQCRGKEGKGSKYARVVVGIVNAVRSGMEEVDELDELKLLRIRTKKHELIITPDDKYLLVVLQDPS